MKKINIGCGKDIKEGWVNLDSHNKNGADLIFDLNDIYKGKKLPFDDNTFDYVYCSHVIEDFIEPMVLIKEFIRICKVGGKIELRTPFETNTNTTNMYHKSEFTLLKFMSLAGKKENYGEEYGIEIEILEYYVFYGYNRLINLAKKIIEFVYNKLPIKLVELTFLKYLFCVLNCRVVYVKTKNSR